MVQIYHEQGEDENILEYSISIKTVENVYTIEYKQESLKRTSFRFINISQDVIFTRSIKTEHFKEKKCGDDINHVMYIKTTRIIFWNTNLSNTKIVDIEYKNPQHLFVINY